MHPIQRLKRDGLIGTLVFALKRLGFVWYNRAITFYELALDSLPNDASQPPTFHLPNKEDMEREPPPSDGWDGWLNRTAILQRLKKGHILFVYGDHKRPQYSQWAERHETSLGWLDMKLSLPPDVIYCTFMHTAPEFRGKGIAYRQGRDILHYLKSRGYARVVIAIGPDNIASIRLNLKQGFKEYQTVHYRRILFVKLYRVVRAGPNREIKSFFGLFKTPAGIWNAFLSGDATTSSLGGSMR